MNKNPLFLFLFLSFLFSCKKDPVTEVQTIPQSARGIFICNEGNFQWGNASLSYFNLENNTLYEDVYKSTNKVPLGDVCQSMALIGGKGYVIVNNSGKIEIIDPATFKSIGTIKGMTSPRYITEVASGKAYVTDLYANNLHVLNLVSNSIIKEIPLKGWTEEMLVDGNLVYVTNIRTSSVYRIDAVSDRLKDSIVVTKGSSGIVKDKNGFVWVLCEGSSNEGIQPAIHKLDPATGKTVSSFTFGNTSVTPSRLKINAGKDTLYYLYGTGVFRMAVSTASLPSTPFLNFPNAQLHGLELDHKSGNLIFSDAIDFVQKGKVYLYSPKGQLIKSFNAGIIPGNFCFYN